MSTRKRDKAGGRSCQVGPGSGLGAYGVSRVVLSISCTARGGGLPPGAAWVALGLSGLGQLLVQSFLLKPQPVSVAGLQP